MSDDLKDLLTDMLQLDPSARLTMDEIIGHPWVQGPVPTQEEVQAEFMARKGEKDKTNQNIGTNTN